jgi:GNAT superfamily N-acetyltransferase
MIIRKITSDDIETVGNIYLKAFDHYEGILKYFEGFNQYVSFFIKQGYSFCSVDEDICCGVGMAYETPDMYSGKTIYVDLLAVLPEYQNKGIGKSLLHSIEVEAAKQGIHKIAIRTACYIPAYLIYNHLNFKDFGGESRYMCKPISDELFNQK